MKTTEWLEHYRKIVNTLQIDPEKDRQSAEILARLITGCSIDRKQLAAVFEGKYFAAVFGAGPSLEADLDGFLRCFDLSDAAVVAADGAVNAFHQRGLNPDIVVTDLDGGDEALVKASRSGAVLVVHAHGDNIEKIVQLVPRLEGGVLGTTQGEPFDVLENFGGFTDGDRAVFMCEEIGVKTIVVAGMDFDGEVGKFSKPKPFTEKERLRKKLKLQIGKTLLETLAAKTTSNLYDVSNTIAIIKGFRKTNWEELKEHFL